MALLRGDTDTLAVAALFASITSFARGHELAHDVDARVGREADACCGSAASGGKHSLTKGTCCGVSSDASGGGTRLASMSIVSNHSAF
jgi:hypothetical protein